MYPTHIVPPLPRKKKIKSLDNVHLNKRRKSLFAFLDFLLRCPVLSNTGYLCDFLSIADEPTFNAKKREAEGRSDPKRITDL